jgi:hypothetical protein
LPGTARLEEGESMSELEAYLLVGGIFGFFIVIGWFLFGHKVPSGAFLFVLLGVDLMLMLVALLEYQSYHLSKKRVEELERLHHHEGGDGPSPEK